MSADVNNDACYTLRISKGWILIPSIPVEEYIMCKKKDISAVLEQLQHCQDHEEKRRILEQSISCETCAEKPAPLVQGDIRCRCEIDQHTEFFNIIEHVKQHRVFEK